MCGCSIHNWHSLSDFSTGLVNGMVRLTVAAHSVYICSANPVQTLTVSYLPKLSVPVHASVGSTWCGIEETAFEISARLSRWKCWKLCRYDKRVPVATARLPGFEPPSLQISSCIYAPCHFPTITMRGTWSMPILRTRVCESLG